MGRGRSAVYRGLGVGPAASWVLHPGFPQVHVYLSQPDVFVPLRTKLAMRGVELFRPVAQV